MASQINLDGEESGVDGVPGKLPVVTNPLGQPVCPVHWCRMVATSSKKEVTYYKCKVEGCTARDSRQRNKIIPHEPTVCPMCQLAMVVDIGRTSQVFVRMKCEKCHHKLDLPKISPSESRQQRSSVDIMDV